MSPLARVLPGLCLVLLITIGCGGQPPDKEMQQAQSALDAARAAGADRFATEEFTAAQQALANAREAVNQRDYRLALDRALDSRERAQDAAKVGADRKAAARVDAERALRAGDAAVAAATERLQAAVTARVPARTLTGPRHALDTAKIGVQEARALFEQGDYLAVVAKASHATASLPAALAQIDTAPAKHKH
jgi:hypothetical protein